MGKKIVAQAARCDINGAKNLFLKNFQALALEFALGPTHPLQSGDGLLPGDRDASAGSPRSPN
ncbi:MAG: hypothetical protein Q8P67_16705 [archaeon]|nr:hypothetical protein [archaeon]